MSERQTPQLLRAYELLQDGLWHDRDEVLLEMGRAIPPGVAARAAEAVRAAASGATERQVERSMTFLVATGRRHLARQGLNGARRIEQRVDEGSGRKQVRLRAAIAYRPPRAEHPPLRTPRVPKRITNTAGGVLSAHMRRGYDLLADGQWHDREEVLAAMVQAIPEADAQAASEYRRTWRYIKAGVEPPPRKRAASDEAIIASGRRAIALETLNNNARILRRTEDGVLQIRLRPRQTREPAGHDQVELGGGIEPHS